MRRKTMDLAPTPSSLPTNEGSNSSVSSPPPPPPQSEIESPYSNSTPPSPSETLLSPPRSLSPPPPPPPAAAAASPPSPNESASPPPEPSPAPPPLMSTVLTPPPLGDNAPNLLSPPPPTPKEASLPLAPPALSSPPPPIPLITNDQPLPPPSVSAPALKDSASPPPPATPIVVFPTPTSSQITSPPPNLPQPQPILSPPAQGVPSSGVPGISSPLSPKVSKSTETFSAQVPSSKPSPLTPSEAKTTATRSTTSRSTPMTSSTTASSNGNYMKETIVGATFAGVLVFFVAFFFVIKKRKKSQRTDLGNHYIPPSGALTNPDAYYHGQPHLMASGPLSPGVAPGNFYGNFKGQAYQGGQSEPAGSKTCFTYEELMDITNGFSYDNLIGEGGFGSVYKGVLPDGRAVAVKQLKAGGGQGEKEFRAEVDVISRVHHRHLVSLVGSCLAEDCRMLVFEFLPNKTLEHHLHGKGIPVLEWPKRLRIAIGSARGLSYLHEDCHPRIIHRDIKSANILLDESFEAQVADFGLARLAKDDSHTHVSTRVMGTFGYLAPEYATSGKLTDKSDVFSFGVVLLELITGRRPVFGDESLVEWARPLLVNALETGEYEDLVDPRLENKFVKNEMSRMIEVAAACVRHSAPKRPRMVQVLRTLDSEGDMPDLSNGVKYGQSMVYNSTQYSADINNFHKMAFGTKDFSENRGHSGLSGLELSKSLREDLI